MGKRLLVLAFTFCQVWLNIDATTARPTTAEPHETTAKPPLTVTSILSEPFLKVLGNDSDAVGDDRYVGFVKDLLNEVASRAKFEYNMFIVADGRYGSPDENGKWSGMIGELTRNEADIAAAPLTITHSRAQVVDFTIPWKNDSISALVKSDSGVSKLEDLLNHTDISYGTLADSSTQKRFQGTPDQPFANMWAHMASEENAFVTSTKEGIERVKLGNYSFITESFIAEYAAASYCDISKIDDFLPGPSFGFALRKGQDDLLEDINEALSDILSDGTFDRLHTTWFDVECSGSNVVPMTLTLLFFSFLALVFNF